MATGPLAGVKNGVMLVENVCVGVDRAEAVVDADPVDALRRVLVGDDERPAGEAVVAAAGLDVGRPCRWRCRPAGRSAVTLANAR